MRPRDFMALAQVQFLLSSEVRVLLEAMPRLVRRLATTTVLEQESSADRIRGAIRWGPTLSERLASGLPHLYVTNPARRAYQTPENELLVHALDAVQTAARATGWHRSSARGIGSTVRDRGHEADRWLQTRALSEVTRRPITPTVRSRVRAGRAARRYRPALDVFDLHARFLRRKDREAVRGAVEQHALLVAAEDKLLELKVVFEVERALRAMGFSLGTPGLITGGEIFSGSREGTRVAVHYQSTPAAVKAHSRYAQVQAAHGFTGTGGMIPDFVLEIARSGRAVQWLLVEVKGVHSGVHDHARRAIRDLLAYRRAFEAGLSGQMSPYGLAVAWGAEVAPSTDAEVVVCSPDTIELALRRLLSASNA